MYNLICHTYLNSYFIEKEARFYLLYKYKTFIKSKP